MLLNNEICHPFPYTHPENDRSLNIIELQDPDFMLHSVK
jgi:hypothetical protein